MRRKLRSSLVRAVGGIVYLAFASERLLRGFESNAVRAIVQCPSVTGDGGAKPLRRSRESSDYRYGQQNQGCYKNRAYECQDIVSLLLVEGGSIRKLCLENSLLSEGGERCTGLPAVLEGAAGATSARGTSRPPLADRSSPELSSGVCVPPHAPRGCGPSPRRSLCSLRRFRERR